MNNYKLYIYTSSYGWKKNVPSISYKKRPSWKLFGKLNKVIYSKTFKKN